jgi:hypothetical protein
MVDSERIIGHLEVVLLRGLLAELDGLITLLILLVATRRLLAVTLSRTCLLRLMMLAGYLNIHCIWRQIDLTGPRDCAAVNEDLLEESRTPQWGKGTGNLFLPQLHPPVSPSLKRTNRR